MYRIYKCQGCGATKTMMAHSWQTDWADFVQGLPDYLMCYLDGCMTKMYPLTDGGTQ